MSTEVEVVGCGGGRTFPFPFIVRTVFLATEVKTVDRLSNDAVCTGCFMSTGQIVAAVEECKASGGCPKDLQPRLEKISDGVEQTSAAAMSYVEVCTMVKVGRLIDLFVSLFFPINQSINHLLHLNPTGLAQTFN